jgi:hypothetical protein
MPLVDQRKEARIMTSRLFAVIATLFLMVGTSACSVGFGVHGGPGPGPVRPPVYAYPYPPAYAYPVPRPYYAPPRYYRPGLYAAPPPAVFGFRFGDNRYDRRYDRRWQ